MESNDPAVAETVELLMRLNNDIATAPCWPTRPFRRRSSIRSMKAAKTTISRAWADSYVFGAGLGGDWYELAGKHADDLSELLEPMFLLNGMLKEDAEKNGERWFRRPKKRLVADIQDNLPVIVQTWMQLLAQQAHGRHRCAQRRQGRPQRPMPCGSGKKFKQCCGSPEN